MLFGCLERNDVATIYRRTSVHRKDGPRRTPMVDDDFQLDWTLDVLETPLVRIRLHPEVSTETRSPGSRCPFARPRP